MIAPRFTHAQIFAGVREDVAECLAVDIEEVTLEANFKYDLGGSSIDYMDLFFRTQKRFGIRSPWPRFVEVSGVAVEELPDRLAVAFPRIQWKERLEAMSTNDLEELFTIDLIVDLLFNDQFEEASRVGAFESPVRVT